MMFIFYRYFPYNSKAIILFDFSFWRLGGVDSNRIITHRQIFNKKKKKEKLKKNTQHFVDYYPSFIDKM